MAKTKIENIDQLRLEIAILRLHRAEQEIYLSQKVTSFSKALNSPLSFIKGSLSFLGLRENKSKTPQEADWVTNLARIGIPFLLNKTLLSGRGFIFKSIVSLLSQNTINSKIFNKGMLGGWIDKLVDWVDSPSSKKGKNKNEDIDYGISPESETYSGKPIH
jgi:hypothetical protein